MKKLLAMAGLLVLASGNQASASIIYDFAGVTPLGLGVFQFKYDAKLSADQMINDTSPGAYAVLYDFGGFIPGPGNYTVTNVAAGLTVTPFQELSSVAPFLTAPPDNPGFWNLRADISGTFNSGAQAIIYRVLANSTFETPNGLIYQAAQARKDVPNDPSNDQLTGNITLSEGPSTAVPEPTSLLLLGSGLVGAAARFRRRKK